MAAYERSYKVKTINGWSFVARPPQPADPLILLFYLCRFIKKLLPHLPQKKYRFRLSITTWHYESKCIVVKAISPHYMLLEMTFLF